jgi:flagellar motor switch protein FliN/FliY
MDNFIDSFSQIISDSIKSVLQTLTSEKILINLNRNDLLRVYDLSKEFKGEIIVSIIENVNNIRGGVFFYRKDLIGLSNLMLIGKFQQEDMFTDEKMDAAMELMRQLISSINVPFLERFGKKVDFQIREILEVDDSLIKEYDGEYYALFYNLQIGEENVNIIFFLDSLLNRIFKEKDGAEEIGKIENVDLLLDIEVPVAVKIGTAQMFLKDLLNLASGNVIELDQSVNEPVELVVNNKTIAYGEVVVADGYFGLKIKEVVNKAERIKRLSDREA